MSLLDQLQQPFEQKYQQIIVNEMAKNPVQGEQLLLYGYGEIHQPGWYQLFFSFAAGFTKQFILLALTSHRIIIVNLDMRGNPTNSTFYAANTVKNFGYKKGFFYNNLTLVFPDNTTKRFNFAKTFAHNTEIEKFNNYIQPAVA